MFKGIFGFFSGIFVRYIFCSVGFFSVDVFSIKYCSKNSFSSSRCIGSEPGINENLADLEMSRIRNELWAGGPDSTVPQKGNKEIRKTEDRQENNKQNKKQKKQHSTKTTVVFKLFSFVFSLVGRGDTRTSDFSN